MASATFPPQLFSQQQLSCCSWPLVILYPGNTLRKLSICFLCSFQKKNLVNKTLAKQYGFLCQIPDLWLKEVSIDPVKSTYYMYLLISLHIPWREGSLLKSSRILSVASSAVTLSSDPPANCGAPAQMEHKLIQCCPFIEFGVFKCIIILLLCLLCRHEHIHNRSNIYIVFVYQWSILFCFIIILLHCSFLYFIHKNEGAEIMYILQSECMISVWNYEETEIFN